MSLLCSHWVPVTSLPINLSCPPYPGCGKICGCLLKVEGSQAGTKEANTNSRKEASRPQSLRIPATKADFLSPGLTTPGPAHMAQEDRGALCLPSHSTLQQQKSSGSLPRKPFFFAESNSGFLDPWGKHDLSKFKWL